MSETLGSINDRALESFKKLREKMKLNAQQPIIKRIVEVENTRIQELMDRGTVERSPSPLSESTDPKALYAKAIEAVNHVDLTFDFINALGLPNNLSLAIGLIISSHKTNNQEDLEKAIAALKGE